jgi:hypothetical protein
LKLLGLLLELLELQDKLPKLLDLLVELL